MLICVQLHGFVQVTDAKGDDLDFSRGRWLDFHKGIVAAPPALHAKLIQAASTLE